MAAVDRGAHHLAMLEGTPGGSSTSSSVLPMRSRTQAK